MSREKIDANYKISRTMLGHSDFGIRQPFFEVGGDSLLLINVRNKINQVLNKQVATTTLFEYPSIEALSDYLTSHNDNVAGLPAVQDRSAKQKQAMKNRREVIKKGVKMQDV